MKYCITLFFVFQTFPSPAANDNMIKIIRTNMLRKITGHLQNDLQELKWQRDQWSCVDRNVHSLRLTQMLHKHQQADKWSLEGLEWRDRHKKDEEELRFLLFDEAFLSGKSKSVRVTWPAVAVSGVNVGNRSSAMVLRVQGYFLWLKESI